MVSGKYLLNNKDPSQKQTVNIRYNIVSCNIQNFKYNNHDNFWQETSNFTKHILIKNNDFPHQ